MAAINWTVIVWLIIGLFALAGFFAGWWKEAVVTIFLVFLVFLLQVPGLANLFIRAINSLFTLIWDLLPDPITNFLELSLGIGQAGQPPHLEAGSPQTWIILLIIFVALAILIGRLSLNGSVRAGGSYTAYALTLGGQFFGALLGALNGWLIISLVRAYLDGSNLPGSTDIATALANRSAALSANGVAVQSVDVPAATIMDGILPWLLVGLALAVFVVALKTRVSPFKADKEGYMKTEWKSPTGYRQVAMTKKAPEKPS
jgi:hypothetical protein